MFESLTSAQNRKIKDSQKLRSRKGRRDQNRFVIDGLAETLRAIQSGITVESVFVAETDCESPEVRSFVQETEEYECNPSYYAIPSSLMEKVSYGESRQKMVAVAETPSADWARFESGIQVVKNSVICVLESIEKPGNIGAIFRTACAAGISGILLADSITDLYNPNVIRASRGTCFILPAMESSNEEISDWLTQNGYQTFASFVDGEQNHTDCDFNAKSAIVLGNEASGLSKFWQTGRAKKITIPMKDTIDSLNVSVTAAVLMYEVARQRDFQ